MQSSTKTDADIQKYFTVFDPLNGGTFQSLRNVFSADTEGVSLQITTVNAESITTAFEVSSTLINTNKTDRRIAEANIASDFINYKLLHNFYNGTHRQEINLWEVFKRDVFPYFSDGTRTFREIIELLHTDLPKKRGGDLSRRNSSRRISFDNHISDVNTKLDGFIDQIETNGNTFLKQHFFGGKDLLRFKLRFAKRLSFERIRNNQLDERHIQIKLWVELYDENNKKWIENHRPHSFLNEAQLTRIAIAIRIGALLTRVTSTDLRVLVLDDMLISLDMSSRMQVVDMLLNKKNKPELTFFDGFQKIILTHDKAFFKLIKRDTSPLKWKYYELDRKEMSNESPTIKPTKEYLEKALEYLQNRDFDACASMLRKELEGLMKKALGKNKILPTTERLEDPEHQMLSDMLNQVKKRLESENQTHLKKFLKQGHDASLLAKLNTDFNNDSTISLPDRGKLKSFQTAMLKAFTERNETNSEIEDLLNEARRHIDFVLNQAAHDTTLPAFESELQAAYDCIEKLKRYIEMS